MYTIPVAQKVSRRAAMLLAVTLAVISVALAVGSSPSLAGTPFCAGVAVGPSHPCFGGARWLEAVHGIGYTHAICVGYNEIRGPCTPQSTWVSWYTGSSGNRVPWIAYNPPGTAYTDVDGNTT